jgi:hypothetical protein
MLPILQQAPASQHQQKQSTSSMRPHTQFTTVRPGCFLHLAVTFWHPMVSSIRNILSTIEHPSCAVTCRYGQPLRLVVAQCEARWFLQELQVGNVLAWHGIILVMAL